MPKRVFLSSTSQDLVKWREIAYRAIESIEGHKCIRMEDFGLGDVPIERCIEEVRSCDLFVGLVGIYYGSKPPARNKSFTEIEYETALGCAKPVLMFITPDDFPLPPSIIQTGEDRRRQNQFRKRISQQRVRDEFKTKAQWDAELEQHIREAIRRHQSEINIHRDEWLTFREEYLESLVHQFERWRERYTDLRLTTDIQVASYKGHRIAIAGAHQPPEKEWFRRALDNSGGPNKGGRERVVILGDPGGGKSTACQRAVFEMAQESLRATPAAKEEMVPIYLELGAYRAESVEPGLAPYERMLALLAAEMKSVLARNQIATEITRARLRGYLEFDHFCFFLDGLNEVGSEHRKSLLKDIREFVDVYSGRGHQFILTTRKLDYEHDFVHAFPMSEFEPLEILELDSAGVREFIMRDLGGWGHALTLANRMEEPERGKSIMLLDECKQENAEVKEVIAPRLRECLATLPEPQEEIETVINNLGTARKLITVLNQPKHARLLWLAQNPSSLKDIIDVFRSEGTIPTSRARLFSRAVKVRLDSQAAKHAGDRRDDLRPTKLAAMQAIATRMMDPRHGLQLPRKDICEFLEQALRRDGYGGNRIEPLLKELEFEDGLLVERHHGFFSFIKQPYQEYFAARELREQCENVLRNGLSPLNDRQLGPIIRDRNYHQVFSTMTGLLTSDQTSALVERLRRKRRTRRLAAMCCRQAEELPEGMMSRMLDWAQGRVQRFSLLPTGFINVIGTLIFLVLVALPFTTDLQAAGAWLTWSIYDLVRGQSTVKVDLVVGSIILAVYVLLRTLRARGSSWKLDTSLCLLALFLPVAHYCGYLGTNLGACVAHITGIALLLFLLRSFATALSPGIRWLNTNTEEAIVQRSLIPWLEILRELGPEGASVIASLREEFAADQFVSERVADAIRRAEPVSARTLFVAIEDLAVSARQTEAVGVLVEAVLRDETESSWRELAADKLCHEFPTPPVKGAMLRTINALGELAATTAYRAQAIHRLREILDHRESDRLIRRRAFTVLKDLGVEDVEWPGGGFWLLERGLGATLAAVTFCALLLALTVWLIQKGGR